MDEDRDFEFSCFVRMIASQVYLHQNECYVIYCREEENVENLYIVYLHNQTQDKIVKMIPIEADSLPRAYVLFLDIRKELEKEFDGVGELPIPEMSDEEFEELLKTVDPETIKPKPGEHEKFLQRQKEFEEFLDNYRDKKIYTKQ